jgi:hypothetical protein
MGKSHRRFNLGICIARLFVDAAAFIIATLILVCLLKSEDAASFYMYVLLCYAACIAVVAFDLYFVIRDIRFIKEKEK